MSNLTQAKAAKNLQQAFNTNLPHLFTILQAHTRAISTFFVGETANGWPSDQLRQHIQTQAFLRLAGLTHVACSLAVKFQPLLMNLSREMTIPNYFVQIWCCPSHVITTPTSENLPRQSNIICAIVEIVVEILFCYVSVINAAILSEFILMEKLPNAHAYMKMAQYLDIKQLTNKILKFIHRLLIKILYRNISPNIAS